MLTRLSVTTVFVCILVLLASACGWGGGNYARSPFVRYQDFVLYQTAPGDPPHIIGYGSMGGSLATMFANVNLFKTSCPGRRPNQLPAQGTAVTGFVTLSTAPSEPVALTLSGPLRNLPHDEWSPTLPFDGTLTPLAPCAGGETLHIEARPGPDLHHRWQGILSDGTGHRNSIVVNLSQVRATATTPGALWGELFFNLAPCARFGSFFLPLDSAIPNSPRAFLMADNSLVVLTGLPATLDPDPPSTLPVTLTFTGGPCNAQTFTSTLTH